MRFVIPIAAAALLCAPAAASADFPHVVTPGETLTSIAATDGLSIAQLAAANGLSTETRLISGTTLMIPPQGGSSVTSAPVSASSSSSTSDEPDGDADDAGETAGGSGGGGSYVVQPGDTLSGIAARAGMSMAQLAADNGIDPNAPLLSGTALRLGTAAASSVAASSQPVGSSAQGNPSNPPYPTRERVSASEVGNIAAANGVPPALAEAIGWQESGFNNDLVSPADARGVMQILPGTWDWIQHSLTPGAPLAPASAVDNVRGGVLMLHSLLNATGGSSAMAAAGYYQGLPSVRRHGLYNDTKSYVNSVMALEHRFAGG
jgi:LysM repeat protein